MKQLAIIILLLLGAGLPFLAATAPGGQAQPVCRLFPETGHSVCGRFLQYWDEHGGLAQQGYPLSAELPEVSDTDGKLYTVQYFERAVFELHPENAPPYDVLLSLLGTNNYRQFYCCTPAPPQTANPTNPRVFPATGQTLGGRFRAYWESHGGLAQQGYPLSEEFQEQSSLNGPTYTVQYFERAVFEYHPENAPPYDVLLTQLGKLRYDRVRDCLRLTERQGQIIAQGTNQVPTIYPPLQTYRVEQVTLPGAITCPLQQPQPFDHYWILTLTGGPFRAGANVWYLWLDQTVAGPARQKRTGELSTVIVDRQYLREGALIEAAYGEQKKPSAVLSERLHFTIPPQGD